jgi:hypothetical protein
MMKSLRKAVALALSLSLAMGGPLAEARPTQSSGSYKSGFSSQRSSAAKSTPSRSPSGSGSFGSFGSRRAPDTDAAPASGGSRSAMNRDLSQKTAQDNAVRTMDERTAQSRALPPSDPVMPRQSPQYGNNQSGNGSYSGGGYREPRYEGNPGGYSQDRPSRWGTAGAAAAGAVLGSVLASGAHANQAPVQQPLPSNVPADVGSIGPVGSGSTSTSPGVGTVPNPMNPDAPVAAPAPQVQEQQPAPQAERPARKESSGIGWFGWVMLGLIGFALYKVFTRRKVKHQGANYSLGD